MLADDDVALGIAGQPVGADRADAVRVALEDRIDERAGAVRLGPLIDGVPTDIREQQPRLVGDPYRALDEHEAVGQLLDLGAGGDERVETRVDAKNRTGTRGFCRRDGGRLIHRFGRRLGRRRPARHRQDREPGQSEAFLHHLEHLRESVPEAPSAGQPLLTVIL